MGDADLLMFPIWVLSRTRSNMCEIVAGVGGGVLADHVLKYMQSIRAIMKVMV